MRISYNWVCDYLPSEQHLSPEELSAILTSIGLEVEGLEKYEAVKGSLEGLVIGEVLEVQPHPNADKLKLTKVNMGRPEAASIVCGAPNVAAGQKVVVAPAGATVYPLHGEPLQIRKAKIRGEQSEGMICAADEIGLGEDHNGILVLPDSAEPGMAARDYFQLKEDWVFEIGLTPNRMDAMSHLGVAKDICAWLSHHHQADYQVKMPDIQRFRPDNHNLEIRVQVDNITACPRYAGVTLTQLHIGPSPEWMQQRLRSVGVRPINNIVDITNFVLHECGQPLHAFDAAAVAGNTVIVKNLPQGTPFVTLDGKERQLDAGDLMICNEEAGMCIAGIFGGLHSGVKDSTTGIFLESACFQPAGIRRSSFRHDLRTDAAMRFEKGTDISNVLFALQRAALLIKEIAGGSISSEIIDIYPVRREQAVVSLSYAYLHKLSGKQYDKAAVKHLLLHLGFSVLKEDAEGLLVAVPYSKPDITLPADIVEEIMRIDGLDNIPVAPSITIAPSSGENADKKLVKEKIASSLSAAGFLEICTNSITNSAYFSRYPQEQLVRMINNLSAELDTMRPSMLETGLEAVAYNLNRKNEDLHLFEFGKIYLKKQDQYVEEEQLCLYLTGNRQPPGWTHQSRPVDIYFLKGLLRNILLQAGLKPEAIKEEVISNSVDSYVADSLSPAMQLVVDKQQIAVLGAVQAPVLQRFAIRQPVWYARVNWQVLLGLVAGQPAVQYREIPRFPAVRRDLALILDKKISFAAVEHTALSAKIRWLQQVRLFDVFESEKVGQDKKSYAVSFIFQDTAKTLTDREIDEAMDQLMRSFTRELSAEIRV